MWTSSAIPCISLFCHRQTHLVIFIFSSCTMHYNFRCLFLHCCTFSYLYIVVHSSFFWSLKIFFCSFQLFEKGHIHNVVSTLINVMKLVVQNNGIISTLPDVVNINVEIDNVNLTLINVVNFNADIHNVVSTLLWHCPTSRSHTTLTTTLRPRWKVSWVLTNIAKKLRNFTKFIKLKTYIFSRIPLNCCFRMLSKRYW